MEFELQKHIPCQGSSFRLHTKETVDLEVESIAH